MIMSESLAISDANAMRSIPAPRMRIVVLACLTGASAHDVYAQEESPRPSLVKIQLGTIRIPS
jgi:hypothetical protein